MTLARYSAIDLYMQTETHRVIRNFFGPGKPLGRLIDGWWLGLCIGVRKGQRLPLPSVDQRTKFIDGSIFNSDPWRVTHLELLALSKEGDGVLKDPRRVVALATEYANFGLEYLGNECLLQAEPRLSVLNRLDLTTIAAD
ncbi:hypothetical protein [Streptomyces sp. STCH 565 A]|uniref:hypothetical protein n=1 Tax=Streptomyces sp. STCH 565 A TaxID=2950532 RepID=UPI002075F782|nr:hypothetical protein [Streptomyces sp. STCH 565 A]MCM8554967.1 hypothetical protein [Streptomyces sp. STCH 565 A]